MFSILKKILSALWRYKKYFVSLMLVAVLFWSLRFPWNQFLTVMLREQISSVRQDIDFADLRLKIFPPGLQLDKVSFVQNRKKIEMDSLAVYLDLSQWLALKKAFEIEVQKDQSRVLVNFYKKSIPESEDSEAKDLYFVKAHSDRFQLESLSSVLKNNPLKGDLSFRSSFQGDPSDTNNIKASLKLESGGIELSPYQWDSTLGPVRLPSMEWKKLELDAEIKEGELILNKIELGTPGDKMQIKARGTGAFKWAYGRFRLSSYNIELQIDLKKDFSFSFLDLMFIAHKQEKADFYRYQLRLIGEGNQVPTMEKLESFQAF